MNIIESIQERCNYIRNVIIPEYEKIGSGGAIGKHLLLQDIKNAETIIASDDVIAMIAVLKNLRETCKAAL